MSDKHVRFFDTSFRDGAQSLWAMGIRHGVMEAIAGDLDNAGFATIEVPTNAIHFKKTIRDLKEDPWALSAMLAEKITKTPKACIGSGFNLNSFGPPSPPELGKMFWKRLIDMGTLQRLQLIANTFDQLTRDFPTIIPDFKKLGMEISIAIAYSISPRHTDALFAEKTRAAAAFKPDVIYLKDQGGLLTVDRIRTLIPIMQENCAGIPMEIHSHCTTGLAPLVYMEALELGIPTLHTGVPPLANSSGQPSVLDTAKNARLMGYSHDLDEALLARIAERFTEIARQDNMPIGATTKYDYAQYIHQIPGGVISNLRFQLAEIGLAERLDEVIEETIQIRKDLGYPIMITPYSQFMCTQAAINVASGERYEMVIDELIRFAQGAYGEDSGAPWMDADLKDKLLARPRAKELATLTARPIEDISVAEVRQRMGAPGISDEELLNRVIMKGEQEILAMRAAGPPRQYHTAAMPVLTLLNELAKRDGLRSVQLRRGTDSLLVEKRSA